MEKDGRKTFFFRMEGGHLVNANQLVQTSIDIDQRVCNTIQLVKRCPSTPNKKNIHNYRNCDEKWKKTAIGHFFLEWKAGTS
jgi:hypothetical protein